MGARLTSVFKWEATDPWSMLKFCTIAIGLPIVTTFYIYKWIIQDDQTDWLDELVLSYDEEDDLDEKSIIRILDAQFNIGKVPALKEEFNRKRLSILIDLE